MTNLANAILQAAPAQNVNRSSVDIFGFGRVGGG